MQDGLSILVGDLSPTLPPPPIRLEGHAHLFFELQRLREQVPPVVTQEGVSSVCVCGYECLGPCGFRKPV